MTMISSPQLNPTDHSTQRVSDSLASIMVTSVLILAVFSLGGPQSMLSVVCTKAMYGAGWSCFFLWLGTVILATPFRASSAGKRRVFAHGFAATLAWCWFGLAAYPADLFSRADLLWTAYVTCGVAIVTWRLFLLRLTLKGLSRRALRANPLPAGLLFFATGDRTEDLFVSEGSLASRVLGFAARIRALSSVPSAHKFVWGRTGCSAIIHVEAMRATDGRVLSLKLALASRGNAETLRRYARDAVRALRCEIRIAASSARRDGLRVNARPHLRRAFLVLEPLALADIAHSDPEWHEPFSSAIELLVDSIDWDADFIKRLETFCGATVAAVNPQLLDLHDFCDEKEESAILHVTAAATLARVRLFRPALGLLQRWQSELDQPNAASPPNDPTIFANQCRRVARSLASEIERVAFDIAEVRPKDAPAPSEADTSVQASRQGASKRFGREGLHPSHTNEEDLRHQTLPSAHAVAPPPRRAREIGVGAFTLVTAGFLWLSGAAIIGPRPLTERIQVVYDVPFGGPVGVASKVDAACVSTTTSTIFLSNPGSGVRTLAVDSLGLGDEGGPGTPVDGRVTHLASDLGGAVFAIFTDAATGSTCLSVRTPDSMWSARIAAVDAAVLAVEGAHVEAVLRGLTEPLFLLKEPQSRLLRYDANDRTLSIVASGAAVTIKGNFVDASSGNKQTDVRTALLLTDDGGGHLYAIEQSNPTAEPTVADLGCPTHAENERAVAVAGSDAGRTIVVTSSGAAWVLTSDAPPSWQLLRAGDQQLKLDHVDMALVTRGGNRLWILRNGVLRTRSLPNSPSPIAPEGWASVAVDPNARPHIKGRSLLVEGAADSVWLATPAKDNESLGAVQSIALIEGTLTAAPSILQDGERLLDADTSRGCLLLSIERTLPGLTSEDELRLEEVNQTSAEPARTLVRATRIGKAKTPLKLSGDILAIGNPTASGTRIVFKDGRTIRFDPTRDTLLPALDSKSQPSVQNLSNPGKTIDALLTTTGTTEQLMLLDADGRLDEMPIALGGSRKNLVNPNEGPPASVMQKSCVGISTPSGIMLFGANTMWSFSTNDAADFWEDKTKYLGTDVDHMIGTLSAAQRPTAAWTHGDNDALRLHTIAGFSNPELQNITELYPALNTAVIAKDTAGSLWSYDVGSGVVKHLSATMEGPGKIVSAGIRSGFVDFLSDRHLHSFSREDGTWTKSAQFPDQRFRMHAIGAAAAKSIALTSENRGAPLFMRSTEPASSLRLFGDAPGVPLRGAVPMELGVVGIDDSDALRWIGVDGAVDAISFRSAPGIDLDTIQVAAARDGALFLLGLPPPGSSPANSRIVRYPIDDGYSVATDLDVKGLTAIEIGSGNVFARAATAVSVFDRATLKQRGRWDFTNEPEFILGRVEGTFAAVAVSSGIERLMGPNGTAPTPTPVKLLTASIGPGEGAELVIAKTAAWGDNLIVFDSSSAWERSANALFPFKLRTDTPSIPDDIILDGTSGGAPWARFGTQWKQLSGGAVVNGGIGWFNGKQIGSDTQTGAVSIGGKIPAAFVTNVKSLSAPSCVEELPGGKVLLAGSDGTSLFDWASQTLTTGEPWATDIRETAEVFTAANGQKFFRTSLGKIYQCTSDGATQLFTGLYVTNVLPESGLAMRADTGSLISSTGTLVANQSNSNAPSDVAQTVGAAVQGGTLYRVHTDRSVDSFNPTTLVTTPLPNLADAMASISGNIWFFDQKSHEIKHLSSGVAWFAMNWVVGPMSIAFKDRSGELGVLGVGNAPSKAPRYALVPGEVIGNIPASSTAVCRLESNVYAFFDLLHGTVLGNFVQSLDPIITAQGVFGMAEDSRTISLYLANGTKVASDPFHQIAIATNSNTTTIAGLSKRGDAFVVESLNPLTLKPVRELVSRHPRVVPIVSESSGDVTRVISLGGGSQLLLGDIGIVLDDGSSLRAVSNPLGTSELIVRMNANGITGTDRFGHSANLLRLSKSGWDFEAEPGIIHVGNPLPRTNIDRWFESEVRTSVASATVATSLGTLDCRSGWITQEFPTDLVVTATGITLRCADSTGDLELLRVQRQDAPAQFSAPVSVDSDGCLSCKVVGGNVQLGVPAVGKLLDCHRVKSFAPVQTGGLAWIDVRNQLWSWRSGDIYATPIPLGESAQGFEFDSFGTAYARTDKGTHALALAPSGTSAIAAATASPKGPLTLDFIPLSGRLGNISWKTTVDSSGARMDWSLHPLSSGTAIPINATKQGFDCFRLRGLALVAGSPVALFGDGSHNLHAPIGSTGLDWSKATAGVATVAPPTPRRLRTELKQPKGNWVTSGDGIALELGGQTFPFVPSFNRFACHIALSATAVRGTQSAQWQVLTVAHGGEDLVTWQYVNGNLEFANRIPLPDRTRAKDVWPSADPSEFVVEVEDASESKRFLWAANAWRAYDAPRFFHTTDAGWKTSDGKSFESGRQSYTLLAGPNPCFACDRVERPSDGSDGLIVTAEDTVRYRGINGQWYQLRANGMPVKCEPPAPRAAEESQSFLAIETRAAEGKRSPNCFLLSGGARHPVAIQIKDGVVPSLDDWRTTTPLRSESASNAFLACGAGDFERVIAWRAPGKISLGPPRVRSAQQPFKGCDPAQNDGVLILLPTGELLVNNTSFGVPTSQGFPVLNPTLVKPIGVQSPAKASELVYTMGNRLLAVTANNPIATFRELHEVTGVDSVRFAAPEGKPEFQVTQGTEVYAVDPTTFMFTPTKGVPTDEPLLLRNDPTSLVPSTHKDVMLSLNSPEVEPALQLKFSKGADERVQLAHTSADRIRQADGGITTVSEQWVANYQPANGVYSLRSVKPLSAESIVPSLQTLADGLLATRSFDGTWTLRLGGKEQSPPWSPEYFSGGTRAFVGSKDDVAEIATTWRRTIAVATGVVTGRWLDKGTAPLALADAFRAEDRVIAGSATWEVGGSEGAIRMETNDPPPLPCAVSRRDQQGWSVQLATANATCELSYLDTPLTLVKGALPMDSAVSVVDDSKGASAILVDRFGQEPDAQPPAVGATWSMHCDSVRTKIETIPASRARREISPNGSKRVLSDGTPKGVIYLALPTEPNDASEIPKEKILLETWSSGDRLSTNFFDDGRVQFNRSLANRTKYTYQPVQKSALCEQGRLAFDIPQRLCLAKQPGQSIPSVCVEMKLGWEWFPIGEAGLVETISTTAPVCEPAPFDDQLKQKWLASSDLAKRGSAVTMQCETKVGIPIIWYPFADRLFVVGPKRIVWVELHNRWSGAPLN